MNIWTVITKEDDSKFPLILGTWDTEDAASQAMDDYIQWFYSFVEYTVSKSYSGWLVKWDDGAESGTDKIVIVPHELNVVRFEG